MDLNTITIKRLKSDDMENVSLTYDTFRLYI